MEPLRIIDIGGGPRERGLAHGRALAPEITRFFERYMLWAAESTPVIDGLVLIAYTMGLLPESRTQAPDLVTEVEAIAEGANLPFEHLWFLNCFDEAGGYLLYKGISGARACTTFAATGHSTTDGSTILGQTWDIAEWFDSVLLRIAPSDDELGALVYTHPGVVGGMGINETGLALVWNSMQPRDASTGVPVPFLVRMALRQPKLTDAIPAVLRPIRAIGFNFILATADGAANVEASARGRHVTYISGHFAHANHYEAPELLDLEGNENYEGSSFVRSGRMKQLLDESVGHVDVETCQRFLRDHAHFPASICAHPDPPAASHHTQAAMIFVPAEKRMLLTEGPPCNAEFVERRLTSVPVTV